jgi:hypothetical protein
MFLHRILRYIAARVDELRQERAEHDKESGTTRDEDGVRGLR